MSGAASTIGTDGLKAPPLTVLVVEDDALVRMLACDIIADGGYLTIEAVNAGDAFAMLQKRPDIAVLFTDVDMPGEVDGLGLARLAAGRSFKASIIITTGAAALSLGELPPGSRFLAKPYLPSDLLEMIAEATGGGDDGAARKVD